MPRYAQRIIMMLMGANMQADVGAANVSSIPVAGARRWRKFQHLHANEDQRRGLLSARRLPTYTAWGHDQSATGLLRAAVPPKPFTRRNLTV